MAAQKQAIISPPTKRGFSASLRKKRFLLPSQRLRRAGTALGMTELHGTLATPEADPVRNRRIGTTIRNHRCALRGSLGASQQDHARSRGDPIEFLIFEHEFLPVIQKVLRGIAKRVGGQTPGALIEPGRG